MRLYRWAEVKYNRTAVEMDVSLSYKIRKIGKEAKWNISVSS